MSVIDNKKGIYEFVLTKSVMLVFILGLVSIFVTILNQISAKSAVEIADYEADRIAKEIDDAIGFKGMSNTVTIFLKPNLKVGNSEEPYYLNITEKGWVRIKFANYPYSETFGARQFGINLTRTTSIEAIDCSPNDLISVDSALIVSKESSYEYLTNLNYLQYTQKVTINAIDTCGEEMKFEESFRESA